jgi:glycine/D-amino acid oxidase-like deaminating enzyme/nitrite reductase/ring-hydroxylating ferredoxin subunit
MNRDGNKKSFWQSNTMTEKTQIIKEKHTEHFDTIIVGAGITGITLAKELQNRGQKCLILEKGNVGFGTTGGTTAHINNFFDSSYDEVISNFGEDGAKTLAAAAKETVQYIKNNIIKYHISCEYSECSFYLFSAEDKQNDQLTKIFDAHQIVGIDTVKAHSIPFTLPFENAIEIKGQAQFHPLRYVNKLVKEFEKDGGTVLTETQVSDFENKDGKVKVICNNDGQFSADNLVWATHIPPGNNRFSVLLAPYRSYALTARLENPVTSMAQTADLYDPYHYIRYHKSNDDYFLIAGGFDHMTGDEENTEEHFNALIKYVDDNFRYKDIVAKWSSQYYVPADGLAYIGQMPGEENIYIATGFNGNGITFGSMASLIIPDLMEGNISPLSNLLSPGRIKPVASVRNVISEVVNASSHFIKDKFSSEKIKDLDMIAAGEGKIIKHDGDTIAAYRDLNSELHLLSPICPHTGCNVVWNPSEITWDCPCHGSRFSIDGSLLNGPAMSDLKKFDE